MDKERELEEYTVDDEQRKREAKEKAKDWITKISNAKAFVANRETQLVENMAFYQGNPYLLAQYAEERPWVLQMNTPYASMAIDTRVASLAANDYIGELQPFREEDVETLKTMEAILKDEWERANINPIIDEALGMSAVVREAYVHVVFNTENKIAGREGEIEAYLLDTPSVLIDPRARRYKDARYIIVAGRITYEEAEENYPEFIRLLPKSSGVMPNLRGEAYLDNDYNTAQDGILTVYTVYTKEGKKIKKIEIIEDMVVEEKVLKGLKRFPIAQLPWKKAAQSCYGLALMDDLLNLQKALCAIESAITNTAVAYSSPAIILRKGSNINPKVVAKTIGAPGVVYVSDIAISEAMAPVMPAKIDDKIVSLKQEFEAAIEKIAGITNSFVGQIGTAGNTAQGSQLAVERAKIIETLVLNNVAEFVEDLTNIFLDYLSTAYAGELITSRTKVQESSDPQFTTRMMPPAADKVDFSFYIDLNKKTPYAKDREKQMLMELYQMERQYDAPVKLINELDILDKFDLSNQAELEKRYRMLSQQTAEMKAQTIINITEAAHQYGAPPELLQSAIMEIVIGGEKETPALDELMAMIEGMAQDMQQAQMDSEQDLVRQGLDPAMVDAAKQQMAQQGNTPTPEDLGLV
jgi:hypothetical protein